MLLSWLGVLPQVPVPVSGLSQAGVWFQEAGLQCRAGAPGQDGTMAAHQEAVVVPGQ